MTQQTHKNIYSSFVKGGGITARKRDFKQTYTDHRQQNSGIELKE